MTHEDFCDVKSRSKCKFRKRRPARISTASHAERTIVRRTLLVETTKFHRFRLDLTSAGLQGLGVQGFLAACLDSSSMVFLEMLSDFIRELSPKHPDSTISTKFPHSGFRPSGLENLFIPVQLDLCPVVADSEQFA